MKMVRKEWKNLFKNKILLISVIAIAFIPIIYTSVFDKSLWNPFQEVKHLPVAVVNEDKSVTLMGQKVDVGNEVIQQLKKNDDINWHFVTQEEAEKGLKDMTYYSIITLPKDFSKSAASVLEDNPKKMEITYTTNGSANYLAEEITEVAANELEMKVRDQVVKSYTEAVDKVAKTMMASLGEAANGSEQLASGSGQLASGLTTYTNGVSQAANGSGQLTSGVNQLQQGIGPLSSGVNQLLNGSEQLSSALGEVDSSIRPLEANISGIDSGIAELSLAAQSMAIALQNFENNLNPGTQQQLSQQIATAQQQIQSLITNTSQLQKISMDASSVEKQSSEIASKINNISADVSVVNANINSAITNVISSTEGIDEGVKASIISQLTASVDSNLATINSQLNAKVADIQANLATLSQLSSSFSKQAGEVSSISSSMADNAHNVEAAINQTEAGIAQIQRATSNVPASVNAQSIVAQLNQLSGTLGTVATDLPKGVNGINQLASGSSELTNGLGQLQSKIPTLSNGVSQLDSGANQLQSGLNELQENSPKLLSGIDQLQAGADELASGLEKGVTESKTVKITNKTIDHFANPAGLKNEKYTKVENYGEALAPYIMSLALYVGCMLFNFIYPIRKTSMDGGTSRSWWLSKVTVGFVASSLMAIIQVTIMLLLGLPMYSIPLLYLTALVTAWCYMSLVMFLAMTFDDPGRFVAMILLVLQLGGAGGTFPVQLQAEFYQIIHPFLPMSYSLYALRNAIAGGISPQLLFKSYSILIILIIVCVSLLRISMNILMKKHKENVSALNDNQKLLAVETNTKTDLQNEIQANINKEQAEHDVTNEKETSQPNKDKKEEDKNE